MKNAVEPVTAAARKQYAVTLQHCFVKKKSKIIYYHIEETEFPRKNKIVSTFIYSL
jgi:hypothetical protein